MAEASAAVSYGASIAQSNDTVRDVTAQYDTAKNSNTPGGSMLQEADKRGYGTSDADLKAYAQAGGAIAATAGCAVVGLAAAAPLCAWIGGKIGGAIYSGVKALIGLFSNNEEVEKELARRARNLQAANVKTELEYAIRSMEEALVAAGDAMIVLHSQLFPDALKLEQQQVRSMLKNAGLYLVPDFIGAKFGDRDICRSGTASPNGLAVPLLPRTIITKNDRFLTIIANKCDATEYNRVLDSLGSETILARYPEVQKAVSDWIAQLSSATKTVTGALINLSSNADIQKLLAESKALREGNAVLAANKDALITELTRRREYEDYYLQVKRAAALKRVEAERKRSEEFLATISKAQRTERALLYVAGAILVASTVATVMIVRRRR